MIGKYAAGLQATQEMQVTVVGNLGPPVFNQALKNQQVKLGKKLEYSLPSAGDPDNDEFTTSVSINVLKSFTTFINNTFHFSPTSIDQLGTFQIQITLSDINPY